MAQPVVDQALIDGTALGLQPRDTPNTGTGLERSTFGFCEAADAGLTGEDLRVARTQRWWGNPTYRTGAPGGVSVGNEVVYYEPGGAQQYLDALAAVPQDCADGAVIDSDTYEFSAEPVPEGLPEGAASLRLAVQHSEGAATVGYVVAIASGDVLSVLYVYGNDAATADAFVPEALALVQDELAAARPGAAA